MLMQLVRMKKAKVLKRKVDMKNVKMLPVARIVPKVILAKATGKVVTKVVLRAAVS